MLAAVVICIAIGASINATLSHNAEDLRLRNALATTSDLEALLDLHVAANSDFLQGVGVAGYSSRGWPVSRAAAVAQTYDRLQSGLAEVGGAADKLRKLRRLSTVWPVQLDSAARNVSLANAGSALIQPALLEQANKTLGAIMVQLAQLAADERQRIADMQFAAQDQLVRQKISLSVASAAGVLLLLFALLTRQRAQLAKVASTIVATEAQRRFKEYFERHPVAMLIFDVKSFEILTANAAAQIQYGATLQELRATSIEQIRPSADVDAFRRDLQGYLASGQTGGLGGVRRHKHADGTVFYVDVTYHLLDFAGRDACFITAHDVSEHEAVKEKLRTQAYEDALTHLPNRLGLKSRLADIVASAAHHGSRLALVFVDIDRFKEINDSLGHTAGDEVLCEVARRLSGSVARGELVVRYAGDEFVAVLRGRGDIDSFVAAATRMKDALNRGFSVGDKLIVPHASVGIAVYPDHSSDPDTLLKYADAAMYRAKSMGANSIQVFNQEIAIQTSRRALLAHALRRAVAGEQFSVVYQPRVDPVTGATLGFEALLRWRDPEQGDVSPALFIPLAEETGLIVQIGEWVLERACRQIAIWARQYPELVVSVNVSPVQFERSDLPALVASTLQRTGVGARNLELEVTEGVLMAPRSLGTLRALREQGISIAIDDFGSGYSSLAYIRSFMADRLKLDMSFVRGIGRSRADEAIVKAVLALGQTLGMRVVAEGVETREQLDFLVENGCDEVQGFWFARPADAAAASAYLGGGRLRFEAGLAACEEE
ncbi:bifunctional diguanylate cyclase/phosphodiesterase [Burkholderia sp. SRS-W-2-2016]|uniref:putative bifunctional diguanylate cyclase/phosphodiesterase n=1 Tax=Burkholderia sp. SRS-W-2-2016 TaxID=1926878 RepID=UPI000A8C3C53|nr:bifunctional diguanylate cyclase/phosphodiesterase [Burkholderia sp. SRS-W-2-2016]